MMYEAIRCAAMSLTFIGAAGLPTGSVLSQEKLDPPLDANPLVTERLAALGDNSSCILEKTRIIADLGDFAKGWHRMEETGPTGRDFTIKMAWMSDRKRAFYCGANHGSPHRFNDAWEYDLPSNTWVLLYKPDYNDRGPITEYDKQTLTVKDGWLRTRQGGPAHPAHTWWGLTYDPNLKSVLWYCAWPPYRLQAKLDAIGATKEDLYSGPPLWSFSPGKKKWTPIPTTKPWPRNAFGASLEHIPELGGSLWQYREWTWLFDAQKRNWRRLPAADTALPIESLVCYDRKRKLLIAHRGRYKESLPRTWHMKVGDGVDGWEQVAEGDGFPNGHDARSLMYFDPHGQVALLYERAEKRIWAYESDSRKWQLLEPSGPPPPFKAKERVIAYMDPERNAFVVIGYGRVWCYRYRRND